MRIFKSKYLILCLLLTLAVSAFSQSDRTGINTSNPHASALLHLESDTSGLLLPRLSSSQMSAISPAAEGLAIHQIGNGIHFYNSNKWSRVFDQETDSKIYLSYFGRFEPALRFRSDPKVGFMIDPDNKIKWADRHLHTRLFTLYQEPNADVGEFLTYHGAIEFESPRAIMLHSNAKLFEYECEPNFENYFCGLDLQGNMQTIVISQDGISVPSPILFGISGKDSSNTQEWRDSTNMNLLTVSFEGDFNFSSTSIVIDESSSNSRLGLASLTNGSVAVVNSSVSAKDRILVTNNKLSGNLGDLYVSINPGTGFTIHSTNNSDQSEIAWVIMRSL